MPDPSPSAGQSPADAALWHEVASGDQSARQALVQRHLPLARSVAGRFRGRAEADDLEQVAVLGLIKAVDRFEPSRGLAFSTYAVALIIGEIRRYLRDHSPIHVPRGTRELAARVTGAREALVGQLGREPTIDELAERLAVSVGELSEALAALRPVDSLERTLFPDEPGPSLEDRTPGQPAEEAHWLESLELRQALRRLDERLRLVLFCRYFRDQSQQETAAQLGVSQMHVSRLERRALEIVRQYLTGEGPTNPSERDPGEHDRDQIRSQ